MPKLIKLFAYEVVNFSSQYGGHGTSSYAACNLAGSPEVGDRYGDFTQAFVLVKVATINNREFPSIITPCEC